MEDQVPRAGSEEEQRQPVLLAQHELRDRALGEAGEWARAGVTRGLVNRFPSKWPQRPGRDQLSNASPFPFHCRLWGFKDQSQCSADGLCILNGTDHVDHTWLTVGS